MRHLWVGHRLPHGVDAPHRDAMALEVGFPLVGRACGEDAGQYRGFRRMGIQPLAVVLLHHVRPPQRQPQAALLAQVGGADHHGRVFRLVAADGGEREAVAMRFRMRAVPAMRGDVRAAQHQGDVQHRQVDMLAPASTFPVEQRGGDGEGAHGAGGVVHHRGAGLQRGDLRRAGHRHQPGHGLQDVVVAGLLRAWAVLAKGGHRAVDQPGIDRRQCLVAESERLEGAGAVVLDEDVRLFD